MVAGNGKWRPDEDSAVYLLYAYGLNRTGQRRGTELELDGAASPGLGKRAELLRVG